MSATMAAHAGRHHFPQGSDSTGSDVSRSDVIHLSPGESGRGPLWPLVMHALADVSDPSGTRLLSQPAEPSSIAGTCRVLDCGGGTGAIAVPLAVAGCEVTVIDISVDALAILSRRAQESGVAQRIHAIDADIEALAGDSASSGYSVSMRQDDAGALAPASFDLVLAHGILQDLPVNSAMAFFARMLRPGGVISLTVANPVSTVLARVISGELDLALAELRDMTTNKGLAERDLGFPMLRQACAGAGLEIEHERGIGVFTDLIPGAHPDGLAFDPAVVAELDASAAQLSPFREIAARLWVQARRRVS